MTDRIHALTVVLTDDTRSDDIQPTIAAILQMRKVLSVTPLVADSTDWSARERVRRELQQKLWDALK